MVVAAGIGDDLGRGKHALQVTRQTEHPGVAMAGLRPKSQKSKVETKSFGKWTLRA